MTRPEVPLSIIISHEIVAMYERTQEDRDLLCIIKGITEASAAEYRRAFIDGLILAAHHLLLEERSVK